MEGGLPKQAPHHYIDLQSQRLLRKHEMPGHHYNTGHLAPIDANKTIVVSAPRLGLGPDYAGAVSFCNGRNKQLQVMHPPQDLAPGLLGEALSVLVIPERDLVVVTHPTPGWLTFWSLKHKAFKNSIRMERVRGIARTSDGKGLWLAHGAGGALGRMEFDTLALSPAADVPQSFIAGSHLLNWPHVGGV
jgi:hypothetical protein